MRLNQLECLFLCLLLIFGLQGCGQKKDANSSEKISVGAITNQVLSHFAQLEADAERGDTKAQYDLGECYFNGVGVKQDYQEAVKWYFKAAEQNYAEAQYNLGGCYEDGIGVDTNLYEATKWYRSAAELGYAKAQFNLGNCYSLGDLVPKDITNAIKWYRKAADQGYAEAQYWLGESYSNGDGVPKDYAEAAKWLQKAAEQDYGLAQSELGIDFIGGRGVPQDYAEAAKWLRKAAEQGEPNAYFTLGDLYVNGKGVSQDYIEAYKWYSLSAADENDSNVKMLKNFGVESASKSRDRLAQQMTPEQIAEAQELAREFKPRKEGSNNSTSPENPTASGSGFFITDDGYLISNYHVVKAATKVRLVTSAGTIDAKVVQVDTANDVALLKAVGKFPPLPIAASRSAHLGGTVATIGFPDPSLQGFSPKLAKGEIASLSGAGDDPRYFQISVPVQPGNSGGALVDERGNVIGIVSAKLDAAVALAASGALPENVNYAVKSSLLLSFLESVPEVAAKLKAPNTVDAKFEEVVKSAQAAAVLVLVY
jgi:TPR repeat protein